MNYPFLRICDELPAVGVLQKLLIRTGATLTPDGIFGRKTWAAVKQFQREHRLADDGDVGKDTWPRLVAQESLPIVDCIDVFDPSLFDLEAQDIRRAGGNPLLIGGMCNGVEQAVNDILGLAKNVFLLRFHGHGSPGTAGVSFGHGYYPADKKAGTPELNGWGERADIDSNNLDIMLPILRRLRPIFGPYGNVQFMHCSTGRGQKGKQLLSRIALELDVPVTAAVKDQLGGGLATFRFEGATVTALSHGTLRDWCRSTPDFVGMCVQ